MTLNDIRNQVVNSINNSNKVKVYFKLETRTPIYGKFVMIEDAKHLASKNMYRFVTEAVIEKFDDGNRVNFTRILTLESILLVKELDYATI